MSQDEPDPATSGGAGGKAARPPAAEDTAFQRFLDQRTIFQRFLLAIAAIAAPFAAIAVGVYALSQSGDGGECRFRITAPRDGDMIATRAGTVLEGTACSDDHVWIFDYPIRDRHYYRENDQPVDVIGERWSEDDESIGSRDDPVGTKYRLVAVRVARACSRDLEALRPDASGAVRLARLPAGCPSLGDAGHAQSVQVIKKEA